MHVQAAAYPEFILRAPLQALYSTGQVFSSVLWMKVCSLEVKDSSLHFNIIGCRCVTLLFYRLAKTVDDAFHP